MDTLSYWVSLSPTEIAQAMEVASRRNQMQRAAGRPDGKVIEDSLDIDVQGACAELAVAKALGLPWDGKFFDDAEWLVWRTSGHDVSGLEVRSTRYRSGRLILHRDDSDDLPFVLVRACDNALFEIVGWYWGRDGKKEQWWEDVGRNRPCFYVPNDLLRPMNDLIRRLPKRERCVASRA